MFASLDKPEQLLLTLESIPEIQSRLSCWTFSLGFKQELDEVEKPIETISKACIQIRESNLLKLLFSLALSIGNYLNGGTNRGRADGFDLSILLKFDDLKSNERSKSLMSYIAANARKVDINIDSNSLKLELSALSDVVNFANLTDYDASFSKLKTQFRSLEVSVNKVEPADEEDRFQENMKYFFDTCMFRVFLYPSNFFRFSENRTA
jgi:hypothetical protein